MHGALAGQQAGVHPEQGVLELGGVGDDPAAQDPDAPGTSTSAAARAPPVSDSATARVSPRAIRAWTSSGTVGGRRAALTPLSFAGAARACALGLVARSAARP